MSSLIVNGGIPHLNVSSSSQWMEIQRNTFKNWVNEQLKSRGLSIFDLRTDFADGVLLVALVEILQREKLPGAVQNPSHNHEKLHNITLALDAIAKDNVTLINIDSSHITEGNTKLILALLWQLVLRYQIGLSNFQNRSWLLAWLQAVIPECHVTNLTSDWNSGIALHALLEFCKKGLSPNWKHLNPLDRVNNCRDAMKLARQHFGIPLVLRPEDLANSNLDELSAITYLSYFTKVGAPGYNATLQRIQPLVKNYPVFNFTTDWKDGRVLCELVHVFGGSIPSWPDLKESNIERLIEGLGGATEIGVQPLLSATEIAEETTEHIGIMAYAARFLHLTPGVISYEYNYRETKIIPLDEGHGRDSRTSTLHSSTHFINGNRSRPSSPSSSSSTLNESRQQLEYTLVRTPSIRRKQRKRIGAAEGIKKDTYSDGVIIYATSHTTVTPDDIRLEAESPTGRLIKMNGDGMYHAQFGADEIGAWQVKLYMNDSMVDSCTVDVCDPSQVKVTGLRAGMAGNPHKFTIDCTNAGRGKLEVSVEKDGRNVLCNLKETNTHVYTASFNPVNAGHYKIAIEYNKAEVRGDIGPGHEELHRRAIFSTAMKPVRDHYKITASCDWQIDYMTGGPIDMYIGDTADVRVYSMQDGTVCNIPHLIADVSNASPGGTLKAEVQYGRTRFPADVYETDKPDIYKIVFEPRGPGTYNVWIIYDGHLAKGSPFIQEIAELTSPTAEGPGLSKGVVAEPCEFTIDARGFPGDVTIDVEGPHHPINSTANKNPDNTHTVTYVPEEVGIHRIHLKLDGKGITGSPFHPKIVDPTRCHMSGEMQPFLERGERIPLMVDREKHIPFDASKAGPGELTANVHGPSQKVPVTIDARGDGKHTLIFTPKEEGKHYIDVFWGGFALPRSPFQGYATPYREEPEIDVTPVHVRATSPIHVRTEPVTRDDSFRRSEPPGGYWVRADNRRPNSPDNGPHKVYILAPTKSEPLVTKATTLPPTRIRVHRHGSDISPLTKPRHYLQPKRSGSIYSGSSVSAKSEPKKKKEPDVLITRLPRVTPSYHYEPASTPDLYVYQTSPQSSSPPSVSPSYIYAKPQKSPRDQGANPKVVLRGKGLKEAELDKPATFTIDGRQAGPGSSPRTGIEFQYGAKNHVSFDDDVEGEPEARVHSIRSEPPVHIKPTGPKQYQCTYTPKVPGAYLLDIKWNGKPLKCCPFKIDVKNPVYPEKVGVTGDLKGGVVGKDIDLKIDPRDAGHEPGQQIDDKPAQSKEDRELTIDCKDPDGLDVPVHLTDNFDGTYRLKVKPEKLGKHILSIRLNKQHVFGSPFAIEIHPTAPHGKIKVWGPGLESGVFPEYQGYFFVDATGAGGGELHVSVMGLKGAFHVEMKRASQKDKLFNCLYHPAEPGMYTINVQWSGKHVPGSPYTVLVASNEMELLDYGSRVERSRDSSSRSSGKLSPMNTTQNSIMY
ncbi:filamin-C-like isoform X4 [Mercenaria mercenaria]|uniref:filamin-C-like isoform X4 n=1 Tax=Mercenaria mercenaria TaxID=6596 RepID=UPI00234EEA89|nr:filamin-C-like isoform X4 [Mercenaria mercenaria]